MFPPYLKSTATSSARVLPAAGPVDLPSNQPIAVTDGPPRLPFIGTMHRVSQRGWPRGRESATPLIYRFQATVSKPPFFLKGGVMSQPTYAVVLLPKQECPVNELTLGEAAAWIRGYNEIMDGPNDPRAVIVEEQPHQSQAA